MRRKNNAAVKKSRFEILGILNFMILLMVDLVELLNLVNLFDLEDEEEQVCDLGIFLNLILSLLMI